MKKTVDIDLGARQPPAQRWAVRPIWLALLAVVGVTLVFALSSFAITSADPASWEKQSPEEGYAWTVARYQIEFSRLRLDLHRASRNSQSPLNPHADDVLSRLSSLRKIGAVLAGETSKRNLPAEFSKAVDQVVQVHDEIEKAINKPDPESARFLGALVELESVDRTLTELAEAIAQSEAKRRSTTLVDLQRRNVLHWGLMAIGWFFAVSLIGALYFYTRKKHHWQRQEIVALQAQRQAVYEKDLALQQKDLALQQKTRYMGGVSHEVRTALQGLYTPIDSLEQSNLTGDDAAALCRIKQATTELARQLHDFETIVRGEEGQLDVHPGPFEANAMLTELVEDHKAAASEKGIELILTLPRTRTDVIADVVRIRQILNNLISNAVKYTQKGAVTIALRPYDQVAGRLTFVVADTGSGIPQAALGAIFEPFERLGVSQARVTSSGIGLSVVQTVVRALGATIVPKSEPGVGTHFVVEIPATAQRTQDTVGRDLSAATILFVDDQPAVLADMVDLAERVQAHADKASSAALAANMLATKRYDLVLIDLDMPGKGGRELAMEVRNGRGLNSETCLIAFSASDNREVGNVWPFDGFAQKPLNRNRLRDLLANPPVSASRNMPTLRVVASSGKKIA